VVFDLKRQRQRCMRTSRHYHFQFQLQRQIQRCVRLCSRSLFSFSFCLICSGSAARAIAAALSFTSLRCNSLSVSVSALPTTPVSARSLYCGHTWQRLHDRGYVSTAITARATFDHRTSAATVLIALAPPQQ
jgi:hypothetical protein